MPTVTLSSKNQITLPVEVVRALGLQAGDKIVAEVIDGRIVLLPKPANWADYFKGSLKGTWGATAEEADRYVAEERQSWERSGGDSGDGARAVVLRDPDLLRILESLRAAPDHLLPARDISARAGVPDEGVSSKLDRLVRLGAVDRVRESHRVLYRLREDRAP